ncbi:MAG: bifunctional hydroxymethylpyrimidine kinase/phosphomethylpyrimidine kinase [Alphaproteobacteria bacterium]|nr:bifunctional hydroxymethylpyrimidine kinase/phosphomethylpyrimidine kinase [Alphaproteobacteria bacterium]
MTIPNLLTIAGSDPSGGAGIQADLKTFAALGGYGMSVITALTAQNTQGVQGVLEIPASFVQQQLESVFSDICVDAVKIGMAGSVDTIMAIAAILKKYRPPFIVLDPVMIAQSGDRLLSPESVQALKAHLIPLADLVTPNLPEAEFLLGRAGTQEEMAKDLLKLKCRAVLVKGGHNKSLQAVDILATLTGVENFSAPWIDTKNTHGTGCTLAAAIAAFSHQYKDLRDCVHAAKNYLTNALRHADALTVGHGAGPVNHGWTL